MKKRLTIADYQAANQKLVEERATVTRERDEARKEATDAKSMLIDDRNDILDLLGGRHDFGGNGILSRKSATKVQIARRAGELVANERFFYDLKREVFGDEVQITGAPFEMKPILPDAKSHVHTIECLPPEAREGVSKLAETIMIDLKQEMKRRKQGRRAGAAVAALLFWGIIIAGFVALGYFGAAAIFG